MKRDGKQRARHVTALICAGAACALTVLMLALFFWQPALLRQVDLKVYDAFLQRFFGGVAPSAPVLVVDIDEKTIQAKGQWPWPRYRLALLIEKLLDAGASVVALDIVLAEPDRTSPDLLQRTIRQDLGIEATLNGIPPTLRDNDALLAAAIKGAPVVLGAFMRFDGALPAQTPPPSVPFAERAKKGARPALERITAGTGLLQPLPELAEAAPVGLFNMSTDQDGTVRRVPLLLRQGDRLYAGLGLRALMLGLRARALRLNAGPDGLESIGLGKYTIPVTPEGVMTVPFIGPAKTFPYVSAADVLDGRADPAALRGAIALVGTSATGLLDIRSTPFDAYTPGVEVHAQIIDAILAGRFLRVPPWNTGAQALLIVLSGLAGLLLFGRLPALPGTLGALALLGGSYTGSALLFQRGLFITPLWSMLTVALLTMSLTAVRFWRTEAEKRYIRGVFSRYVSPEVVGRIVDRGETVLRGESRDLSIMFTDIRGFTSLSEKLTPEQVVSLLNRYFTPMTGLVRGSGGTLDKFIGDALMAFWNAPLDVPDHPRKAVRTALDMQDSLAELNVGLEADFGVRLAIGAGVHTGPARVGNMGSDDLTSYTAIGDAVNLASRLEGLCSRFGMVLVMSGETAALCGLIADPASGAAPPLPKPGARAPEGSTERDLFAVRLAALRVKGRHKPVQTFTALRRRDALARADELARYTAAQAGYDRAIAARDSAALRAAGEAFAALGTEFPKIKIYGEYGRFCADLVRRAEASPDADWDGVWTLTSK